MALIRNSLILLIFLFQFSHAQQVNWMSIEKAQELQKNNPKNIIMDVYTEWCGPCKLMDKNTFQNKDVAEFLNENFYAVKFNAEGGNPINFKGKVYKNPSFVKGKPGRNSSHNFARYLGVYSYPTLVFFDESANPITPITGYLNPKQLEIYLNLFKDKKYLEIKNQEDFKKFISGFVSSFKG